MCKMLCPILVKSLLKTCKEKKRNREKKKKIMKKIVIQRIEKISNICLLIVNKKKTKKREGYF